MTDREQLEREALRTCSADIYYILSDTLDNATDKELYEIIKAKGNHKKELAIQ